MKNSTPTKKNRSNNRLRERTAYIMRQHKNNVFIYHFLTLLKVYKVEFKKKTLFLHYKLLGTKETIKSVNNMKTRNLVKASVICLMLGLSSCLYAGSGNDKTTTKAANTESLVKHINKEQFKKLVVDVDKEGWNFLGDKPCILDFYASWCGPCRMISPYLDDLSKTYKGQINIYKINVDEEKDLARYFGASSIPLLIFIPKEGQPQASRGALPKEEINNAIKNILLKK